MWRAALLGLLGLPWLVACAPNHGSALDRVMRRGVLRWGGDLQGGAPYVVEDPTRPGHIVGFEVELADAIAKELGVRAEFVQQDWSALVPALERGSFDLALNGLEVTPARAARVTFTRPYYVFTAQLVVRRDSTHAGLADLRGKRVGTLASSFSYDLLRERGDVVIVPYEGVEEPYADLEHGRLDAVLLDDIIAARYGLTKPGLRAAENVRDGFYAAACPKDDPSLCEAVNTALERIVRRGELTRILARWQIDNARQARVTAWSEEDARALSLTEEAPPFSAHHMLLFAKGALVTLVVSVGAMLLAVVLGLAFAVVRLFGPRPASMAVVSYVELFRGTPVLLQLYVLYFGAMPWLRAVTGVTAGTEWDALVAAVLGLGLNYAAYEAEIYRAGIQAVPAGQLEAAQALGMGTGLALRRVVLPQAVRIALPGVTNDFIALLKDSSLVSVITVVELTKHMTITAVDVRSWLLPGAVCALFYLAMSYPLSRLSQRLERRLAG